MGPHAHRREPVVEKTVEEKLIPLPPETTPWPGHDYGEIPFSTIDQEMEENISITDFILVTDE